MSMHKVLGLVGHKELVLVKRSGYSSNIPGVGMDLQCSDAPAWIVYIAGSTGAESGRMVYNGAAGTPR